MNTQLLFSILLGIVLLAWISYRQFTWRAVREGRVWMLPAILAVVGIGILAQSNQTVTAVDLGLLALEIVISVGTGTAMGMLARFRVARPAAAAAPAAAPRSRGLETRTGWLGLVLWLVFIAARVGFAFWGHAVGAALLESSGAILIVLGFNRGARALVLDLRATRLARDLATA